MPSMAPRVLTTGENWVGCTGRACTTALRKFGCDVAEVNIDVFVPQWRRRFSRAVARLTLPISIREFNQSLLYHAAQQSPEFFLAFKGPYVEAATLRKLRKMGIRLYNYYPDTSAFAHGPYLPQALPEYDCIFYTKPFWDGDVRRHLKLQESVFLHHGYDSESHQRWPLTKEDLSRFQVDVAVIAFRTSFKERVVQELLELRPDLDLRIWGSGWERAKDARIRRAWQGGPLSGQVYSRALQAARINLALTSGIVQGASKGDDVTTRTFEIPACGGFMLHQRNPEVLELFEEGKEIACYATVQELAEKVDYYLAHPEERQAIAERGHRRCVPAYSYDNRMRSLLDWHSHAVGLIG